MTAVLASVCHAADHPHLRISFVGHQIHCHDAAEKSFFRGKVVFTYSHRISKAEGWAATFRLHRLPLTFVRVVGGNWGKLLHIGVPKPDVSSLVNYRCETRRN